MKRTMQSRVPMRVPGGLEVLSGHRTWIKPTLAEKMDAGTIWINKHAELDPTIPFGGAKQSGLGNELGEEGLEEFTQLKIINMAKAS